ncbi:MAG: hypothetical protein U1E02_18975, partial [Hydrogenophaga sp.]|nr:hypothetical protein [Hydrogenophaga sp.]
MHLRIWARGPWCGGPEKKIPEKEKATGIVGRFSVRRCKQRESRLNQLGLLDQAGGDPVFRLR